MNRQDDREDDRQVSIKRRTKVMYRWGGRSIWLPDLDAERIVARDRKRHPALREVAYIVRCRPKRAPSTSLSGNERGAPWW